MTSFTRFLGFSASNVYVEGTSSSGTPGTVICELAASPGFQYVSIVAQVDPFGTNSELDLLITYSDDTTETVQFDLSESSVIWGPFGATATFAPTTHGASPAASTVSTLFTTNGKKVKSLAARTVGAGTSARAAYLSAVKITS